ncbi:MAG: hypothetical protein K8R21_11940 [Leptospira sp.]|nr:hypothetical protein [Leptospira sp.]
MPESFILFNDYYSPEQEAEIWMRHSFWPGFVMFLLRAALTEFFLSEKIHLERAAPESASLPSRPERDQVLCIPAAGSGKHLCNC